MGSICQILDMDQNRESCRKWAQNGRQGLSRRPRGSGRLKTWFADGPGARRGHQRPIPAKTGHRAAGGGLKISTRNRTSPGLGSYAGVIYLLGYRSAGLGRTRLFHPWGCEPEGGWSGSDVSVSHIVRPRQGSGLMGLVGSLWVPSGHVRVPYGPVWVRISVVHRYGTVESSVRARRIPSGHIGF